MADNHDEVPSTVVRDYFIKNGGKVKRHDLFDHFRSQLDKSSDEGKLKNKFGDIVNSLAFLQNIEGEKYFVLKKRNGSTPVQNRRPPRAINQRKEKGVSLPVSMRNFRFSATADDSSPGSAESRSRSNSRSRQMLKSDSLPNNYLLKINDSNTSITEIGPENDSGVDTALSSVQSESPRGSRHDTTTDLDQLSQHSGDTGIFGEDDQYDHDLPSHVLSGFEKSWMMSTLIGNKSNIICHLDENPSIVFFKDFVMGYTALHWAAKQGSEDILRLLILGGANVNAKSNGGYTALHLASMHGRINVINILIDECHVDIHIRDHSGREPKDVVMKNSSDQIKLKLRDPVAAIALQDIDKKLPPMPGKKLPATPTSGKIKKLGKILTRKHHNTSTVDGAEEKGKLSDSMGSLLDNENIMEHEEHISESTEDKESLSDSIGSLQHNEDVVEHEECEEHVSDAIENDTNGNLEDPMEAQDTLEDTNLTLEAWERENVGESVDYE